MLLSLILVIFYGIGSFCLGLWSGSGPDTETKDHLLNKAINYFELIKTPDPQTKIIIDKWIEEANNEMGK